MEKKEYPKSIGAVWSKESSNGEYLSIQVEINGVKHNYTAFANRFYEEGGKKPKYNIMPPRQAQDATKQADTHQSRIDFVNAEKAKLAKARASDPGMSYNQPSTIIEDDQFPF